MRKFSQCLLSLLLLSPLAGAPPALWALAPQAGTAQTYEAALSAMQVQEAATETPALSSAPVQEDQSPTQKPEQSIEQSPDELLEELGQIAQNPPEAFDQVPLRLQISKLILEITLKNSALKLSAEEYAELLQALQEAYERPRPKGFTDVPEALHEIIVYTLSKLAQTLSMERDTFPVETFSQFSPLILTQKLEQHHPHWATVTQRLQAELTGRYKELLGATAPEAPDETLLRHMSQVYLLKTQGLFILKDLFNSEETAILDLAVNLRMIEESSIPRQWQLTAFFKEQLQSKSLAELAEVYPQLSRLNLHKIVHKAQHILMLQENLVVDQWATHLWHYLAQETSPGEWEKNPAQLVAEQTSQSLLPPSTPLPKTSAPLLQIGPTELRYEKLWAQMDYHSQHILDQEWQIGLSHPDKLTEEFNQGFINRLILVALQENYEQSELIKRIQTLLAHNHPRTITLATQIVQAFHLENSPRVRELYQQWQQQHQPQAKTRLKRKGTAESTDAAAPTMTEQLSPQVLSIIHILTSEQARPLLPPGIVTKLPSAHAHTDSFAQSHPDILKRIDTLLLEAYTQARVSYQLSEAASLQQINQLLQNILASWERPGKNQVYLAAIMVQKIFEVKDDSEREALITSWPSSKEMAAASVLFSEEDLTPDAELSRSEAIDRLMFSFKYPNPYREYILLIPNLIELSQSLTLSANQRQIFIQNLRQLITTATEENLQTYISTIIWVYDQALEQKQTQGHQKTIEKILQLYDESLWTVELSSRGLSAQTVVARIQEGQLMPQKDYQALDLILRSDEAGRALRRDLRSTYPHAAAFFPWSYREEDAALLLTHLLPLSEIDILEILKNPEKATVFYKNITAMLFKLLNHYVFNLPGPQSNSELAYILHHLSLVPDVDNAFSSLKFGLLYLQKSPLEDQIVTILHEYTHRLLKLKGLQGSHPSHEALADVGAFSTTEVLQQAAQGHPSQAFWDQVISTSIKHTSMIEHRKDLDHYQAHFESGRLTSIGAKDFISLEEFNQRWRQNPASVWNYQWSIIKGKVSAETHSAGRANLFKIIQFMQFGFFDLRELFDRDTYLTHIKPHLGEWFEESSYSPMFIRFAPGFNPESRADVPSQIKQIYKAITDIRNLQLSWTNLMTTTLRVFVNEPWQDSLPKVLIFSLAQAIGFPASELPPLESSLYEDLGQRLFSWAPLIRAAIALPQKQVQLVQEELPAAIRQAEDVLSLAETPGQATSEAQRSLQTVLEHIFTTTRGVIPEAMMQDILSQLLPFLENSGNPRLETAIHSFLLENLLARPQANEASLVLFMTSIAARFQKNTGLSIILELIEELSAEHEALKQRLDAICQAASSQDGDKKASASTLLLAATRNAQGRFVETIGNPTLSQTLLQDTPLGVQALSSIAPFVDQVNASLEQPIHIEIYDDQTNEAMTYAVMNTQVAGQTIIRISQTFYEFLQRHPQGSIFLAHLLKEELYEIAHNLSGPFWNRQGELDLSSPRLLGEINSSLFAANGYTAQELLAFSQIVGEWYTQRELDLPGNQSLSEDQWQDIKRMEEMYRRLAQIAQDGPLITEVRQLSDQVDGLEELVATAAPNMSQAQTLSELVAISMILSYQA